MDGIYNNNNKMIARIAYTNYFFLKKNKYKKLNPILVYWFREQNKCSIDETTLNWT